ncbi:MAG: DNA polymerase III subunit alpha, partial [Gammaproteobacteria bacterium]
MKASFVHLHLHTEYSIVDSVVRVRDLMTTTAAAQMPAVALTDQNNLFALVKFYRAALKAGIKPIVGAEIWLQTHADDCTEGHSNGNPDGSPSRLILLCRNNEGYRNLSRLLTRGYLEGQRDGIPVINRDWLQADATAGLMALSGAREG